MANVIIGDREYYSYLGDGMANKNYYRLGNIGFWLKMNRQIAGLTQTEVADRMRWPHGAIGQIERGQRIPKALTVRKYLDALEGNVQHFGNFYSKVRKG